MQLHTIIQERELYVAYTTHTLWFRVESESEFRERSHVLLKRVEYTLWLNRVRTSSIVLLTSLSICLLQLPKQCVCDFLHLVELYVQCTTQCVVHTYLVSIQCRTAPHTHTSSSRALLVQKCFFYYATKTNSLYSPHEGPSTNRQFDLIWYEFNLWSKLSGFDSGSDRFSILNASWPADDRFTRKQIAKRTPNLVAIGRGPSGN